MMCCGRIGVLAGGPSSEREISLRSGRAVYDALVRAGYNAVFIDTIDNTGDDIIRSGAETIFIALHGVFGEDGTVQRLLEDMRLPYTGSGPEASRLALDKIESRIILKEKGINAPRHIALKKGEVLPEGAMALPFVVKPSTEGSSVGLSIVRRREEIAPAINGAFKYSERVIAEDFIKGRELTVGILEDRPLPVVEIITANGCYDFDAKYKDPSTRYLVPAPLDSPVAIRARKTAIAAHRAHGCKAFSRVDMILSDGGDIYVLEINTIPGLTSRSLLPKAASAAGIGFLEMCEKILKGACSYEEIQEKR